MSREAHKRPNLIQSDPFVSMAKLVSDAAVGLNSVSRHRWSGQSRSA
jgi:hypothetical protein